MANNFLDYDYTAWYESARALLNMPVKITAAQSPFQNQTGYINDVLSPDKGKTWNRVLIQPDSDPNQLIELGQGEYIVLR